MNWYHRGEGRYVEYGTSFKASQTFGFKRSLTDTIYNMNLEHLSPRPGDGLRDARRRRRPHRRHDLPDVPRPPPPRGHERDGADAARLDGLPPRRLRPARVLLRRHLRLAQDRLPLAARAAGRARPARGLRRRRPGRERPLRLPAALAARQRHALAQERPVRAGVLDRRRRQADRAPDARRRRARRVPRGPRDDRALRPLAVAGRAARSTSSRRFDGFGRAAGAARVRRDGRAPRSRSARPRARRRSTCSTASGAPSCCRGSSAPRSALEGVDLVMHLTDHPDGEGAIRGRRGELRFMPGGDADRPARASAGASRATSTLLDLAIATASSLAPTYPDALGRVWSALRCRDLRRGAASAPPRLRVHRLGRRPPRRRRLARVAARQRLARGAAVVRDRARPREARAAVVAARRRADGARALRRRPLAVRAALLALGHPARALAPRRRPPRASASPARYDVAAARGRKLRAARDVMASVAAALPEVRRARRGHATPTAASTTRARPSAAGRSRSSRRRDGRRGARRSSRRPSSTTAAAACSRAGRATRSSGRWRAATPGASGASPTRCGSGCRCARCSCCRSRAPPLRLLHLDLAVLLAFSVSYAFFNARAHRRLGPARLSAARLPAGAHARHRGRAGARARAAAAAADRAGRRRWRSRRSSSLGFRTGLNVIGSNVIDVGYASVIGADHFGARPAVYGHFPPDNAHGDTYGPVLYYAYVPFEALLPWSGTLGRPARRPRRGRRLRPAHRGGLWLLGRRLPRAGRSARCSPTCGRRSRSRCSWPTRTPTTGSSPLLVTARAARARARPPARGALAGSRRADEVRAARARAAVRDLRRARRPRGAAAIALSAAGFAAVAALALSPVALGGGLRTFYDRTLGFQADRGSPFSVWGLYDLPAPQRRAARRRCARASPSPSSRAAATRSPSPRSAPPC